MSDYAIHRFPASRIATIDVGAVGLKRHHVVALLEIDVTVSRRKIREYKKTREPISFSAWLVKAIGQTVSNHKRSAAFLLGKRSIITFDDINVSFLVEKDLAGEKVPFPVLLQNVNETSMEAITFKLRESKRMPVNEKDIVLQGRSTTLERLYYRLPGFIRRMVWKCMLSKPRTLYKKMGNVAITSIGMMGKINGWFIPISIHPLCFGIGPVIQKPAVVNGMIEIREILNLTVLIDHDVIDGAPMARFINELTKNIEGGVFL